MLCVRTGRVDIFQRVQHQQSGRRLLTVKMIGCGTTNCAGAVTLTQGHLRFTGGVINGVNGFGFNVASANSTLALTAMKAVDIAGAQLVLNSGNSQSIRIDPSCDFSSLVDGQQASATLLPKIIASAATLALPAFNDLFKVTGTTGIGHISGGYAGRKVTLIFQATITVFHSIQTDGVRLQGSANFNGFSFSTLTLVYGDSQWFEVSRTV